MKPGKEAEAPQKSLKIRPIARFGFSPSLFLSFRSLFGLFLVSFRSLFGLFQVLSGNREPLRENPRKYKIKYCEYPIAGIHIMINSLCMSPPLFCYVLTINHLSLTIILPLPLHFGQSSFFCKFAQAIDKDMAMTSIPALHDTKYDPARLGKGTKLAVALAVLFFLLASCRPVHYPQSLLVADSLCAAHPQRALEWLDALRPRMEQERKGVRMYYDLLCIKAQDKAYIPHTSDSLIQAVLHYYEKRDDRRHLPEAYYYAGRVASDLGDAPQALDYFGKALEAMPEGAMTDLRSRVVSQMGTLFYRQRMYPEALEMYKQSLACDSVRRDSVGMAFSLRDVGAVYYILGDVGSALSYYLKAYEICRFVPSSGCPWQPGGSDCRTLHEHAATGFGQTLFAGSLAGW